MKISIITVVLNCEKFIRLAIESVLQQTYEDIEFIIIDGGSTDETIAIIDEYDTSKIVFISERDNGIYDAMNKGILLSTGEVIAILNSDDVYFSKETIAEVMACFRTDSIDCLYGDLACVSRNDFSKVIRYWKSEEKKKFVEGWHPPHPTFFVRKSVYNKYGLFNTNLRIASDFEIMLRFIERYKSSLFYLPKILVIMRAGGESNKSITNLFRGYRDIKEAFRLNSLRMPFMYPYYRYKAKIKQFFL